VFVVPGRLHARTGGSIYNHRIVSALRARGWAIDVHELDGEFPTPSADAIAAAAALLATVGDDTTVVIDGLAYCAMADVVVAASARLRLVALVHMLLLWSRHRSSTERQRGQTNGARCRRRQRSSSPGER
jgi:hypothetical protein